MEAGKAEVTLERRQSQGREGAAIDVTVWRLPLIATLLASAGVVALYFDTFRSLVSIWSRSDTYAHGFFILPISLYLVWESRDRLRGVYPSPDPRAVAPIVLMGLGW